MKSGVLNFSKTKPLGTGFTPAVLSIGMVAALLWYFHDRFWWPVDDGIYAYVAQRLLAGDRLHEDLIDIHGGYGNWINAAALSLFGEDLVSLRYPLVLATLLQCGIVFWLLRPRGIWVAAAGVLAAGAFSFIQFLNPSANWYALLLAFLMAGALTRLDPSTRLHLVGIGALLGVCFLMRQLSGVILALGTLSWLLFRLSKADPKRAIAGRALALFMAMGLFGYLFSKQSLFGFFWFGIWPLALLGLAAWKVNLRWVDALRLTLYLGIGVMLAAMPMLISVAMNGTFFFWLRDIFWSALTIHQQDFIERASFDLTLRAALVHLVRAEDAFMALNGVYWILLLASVPVTGILALRATIRAGNGIAIGPLAILAPFWGVIVIHYQIAIYFYFALPVILTGLLWIWPSRRVAIGITGLALWAVIFHAGQPLSRGLAGIIAGERIPLEATEGLPRVSLKIERLDQEIYSALLDYLEANASPDELLMTLPMEPQWNFITGRRSPMPYYGTPLGLRNETDLADSVARLKAAAPLFIIHRREDKYLTPLSVQLLEAIKGLSLPPKPFGPFDVYRLPGDAEALPAAPRQ